MKRLKKRRMRVMSMTELVKGSLKDVFKDDDISAIIETELRLVRVERENVEQRKEYIKELVEAFKKEDWVKAIIICPDYDPECETCEEVMINIVPTYVDELERLESKYEGGEVTPEEFYKTYGELYTSTVRRLCRVEDKVSEKYPWEIESNISVFLADDRLASFGAKKCYVVYEKERG